MKNKIQNKIELIDKIIEKSIKKIKLMEELKESLLYESADYHLVKIGNDNFSLYKKLNKTPIFNGNHEQIKSFMKKRKISSEQVFRKTFWEHIISND